jgi:hypothetical protein
MVDPQLVGLRISYPEKMNAKAAWKDFKIPVHSFKTLAVKRKLKAHSPITSQSLSHLVATACEGYLACAWILHGDSHTSWKGNIVLVFFLQCWGFNPGSHNARQALCH